jgi:hypothetical protein
MRTLVITPCSAKKRGDTAHPASVTDLATSEHRRQAETQLAALTCPAAEMYTGRHHCLVMGGLQAVWEKWGRGTIDLLILSAGHGLLDAEDVIIPYDVSSDQFDQESLGSQAVYPQIPERATALVRPYDLVFYLLSGRYLEMLGLPLQVPKEMQQIVLTDRESLALVPPLSNLHPVVAAGNEAAQRWHVKAAHVCGFLFGRLCGQVAHHGPAVLEWLQHHPQDTELLFYKQTRWRPQWSLWERRHAVKSQVAL